MADQIVTITMAEHARGPEPNTITIDWTSATAETVTVAIGATYHATNPYGSSAKLMGFIDRVVTNPGSTAPTEYNATLTDVAGVDVMEGTLSGRSATESEQVIPPKRTWIDGELTLNITGAGAEKTGTLTIYMSKAA